MARVIGSMMPARHPGSSAPQAQCPVLLEAQAAGPVPRQSVATGSRRCRSLRLPRDRRRSHRRRVFLGGPRRTLTRRSSTRQQMKASAATASPHDWPRVAQSAGAPERALERRRPSEWIGRWSTRRASVGPSAQQHASRWWLEFPPQVSLRLVLRSSKDPAFDRRQRLAPDAPHSSTRYLPPSSRSGRYMHPSLPTQTRAERPLPDLGSPGVS